MILVFRCLTVQNFRLLDYVILLYASPWNYIKKPGICFQ